jgi:hypothetical protein
MLGKLKKEKVFQIIGPAIVIAIFFTTIDSSYPSIELKYMFLTKFQIWIGVLGMMTGFILYQNLYLEIVLKIKEKNKIIRMIGFSSTILVMMSLYILMSSLGIKIHLVSNSYPINEEIINEKYTICKIEKYNEEIEIEENEMRFLTIDKKMKLNALNKESLNFKIEKLENGKEPYIEEKNRVVKPPNIETLEGKLFYFYYGEQHGNEEILKTIETIEIIFYLPNGDSEGFIF